MLVHLFFRLGIWLLLTADLSPANIMIGIAIAFVIPRNKITKIDFKEWLKIIKKIIISIPQAYLEALEIIIRPHKTEILTQEKVAKDRSPLFIFLDIFIITFTPKTIVLKYQKQGWYDVHRIERSQ